MPLVARQACSRSRRRSQPTGESPLKSHFHFHPRKCPFGLVATVEAIRHQQSIAGSQPASHSTKSTRFKRESQHAERERESLHPQIPCQTTPPSSHRTSTHLILPHINLLLLFDFHSLRGCSYVPRPFEKAGGTWPTPAAAQAAALGGIGTP